MPFVDTGLVIEHQQVAKDLYELEFINPKIAEECQAGQFLQVLPGNNYDPLLRRPISLFDVDKKLGSISLLYKVIGKGTKLFTNIKPKEQIQIMGPLGKGFTIIKNKNVVLVGGGVGVAPLVYLARVLKENGCKVTLLHGTENSQQLVTLKKLREIDIDFMPATMDGSAGYKGYVTKLLQEKLTPHEIDYLYTCGPEAMMSAVVAYARQNHIAAEVSLEEHMACGVGACLGCARKLKPADETYIKVCKDGPVFNIEDIEI